jgi:hypothetical protein
MLDLVRQPFGGRNCATPSHPFLEADRSGQTYLIAWVILFISFGRFRLRLILRYGLTPHSAHSLVCDYYSSIFPKRYLASKLIT